MELCLLCVLKKGGYTLLLLGPGISFGISDSSDLDAG